MSHCISFFSMFQRFIRNYVEPSTSVVFTNTDLVNNIIVSEYGDAIINVVSNLRQKQKQKQTRINTTQTRRETKLTALQIKKNVKAQNELEWQGLIPKDVVLQFT